MACFLKLVARISKSEPLIFSLLPRGVYALKISFHFSGAGNGIFRGSRNLVGIAIQLSDSEEEEFFVGYPMLISPEKFDFGIERFGCGI